MSDRAPEENNRTFRTSDFIIFFIQALVLKQFIFRFEVLAAMRILILVLRVVTSCGLAGR
jgi:hypothetical protein